MRRTTSFVCQQCGYESPQWLGRCSSCQAWNSLVETVKEETAKTAKRNTMGPPVPPKKLQEIESRQLKRTQIQIEEFNRVVGGGIVPGSVVLLAGEPGIGKSTLLLQIAGILGGLYVSGEESLEQIKIRAERLKIEGKNLSLISETNVENIIQVIEKMPAKDLSLVIVDSIQTIWTEELNGVAGSVGQVRGCAAKLLQLAKKTGFPLFLVGHITKEGAIAGPMVLTHMVDTVLYFEGEKYQSLRLLRVVKNRFGPTEEVGVFQMVEEGIKEVRDPSGLFLYGERQGLSGSSLVVTMEGTRPLIGEIQALVVPTKLPIPRRTVTGLDFNRVQLLIALLQKRVNLPLFYNDIFVNIVGGLKVFEPGVDLGICLAIASSFKNKPLPADLVAVGEVGLLGEIRSVANLEKRVKEAKRLGLKEIVTSMNYHFLAEVVKKYLP
ncbi:MAG: DNA repair protein RadA [bacterium]|nr:DNA repair protein RadA [bacterium]